MKLSAKLLDPIGVLSPFIIRLKILFQQICIAKFDWDKELQGEMRSKFLSYLSELPTLNQICIPRCYFNSSSQIVSTQLHAFSDASELEYSYVAYLRTEYKSGEIGVGFVTSKSKVAPVKTQSVPRLELMAACLLSEQVDSVYNVLSLELTELPIEKVCWVDSSATLCWIRNEKPWKKFIRDRVKRIRSVTDPQECRYVPGPLNPADLPTRGLSGKDLLNNRTWLEGPQFLKQHPDSWPETIPTSVTKENEANLEIIKNPKEITFALLTKGSVEKELPRLQNVIQIDRFSSKLKLIRTFSWVLRFVENLKLTVKGEQLNQDLDFSAKELEGAEITLLRSVQSESFTNEILFLTGTQSNTKGFKPTALVKQFNLFLDENGILRARSRVCQANISESTKFPVLLSSRHVYSEMIIKECHNFIFHNGVKETLNVVRQRYWILRGREAVKRIVRQCVVCKKFEGLPFKQGPFPDLPQLRVDDSPPFSNTGLDFAGPLYVHEGSGDSSKATKVYVLLFTCASTRAVHLEIVERLDVETFLRTFRRFAARRGLPSMVLSDNTKTFKTASKEIRKIIRAKRVQTYFANKRISWRFSVERAPWWGRMWERLVRSVKHCFKKVIGLASLKLDELQTLLVEVECIINSRPITYVYDDTDGVTYPLTPSHLLYGRTVTLQPNDKHFEIVSTNQSLTKRAMYHRKLLDNFTKRWRNEYQLDLRELTTTKVERGQPHISVGDMVILKNENTKRCFWKTCKVVELIKGKDNVFRAAKIRVAIEKGTTVLSRPLRLLIPLEISCAPAEVLAVENPGKSGMDVVNPSTGISTYCRPRRNAAIIGEILRKDNS